MKPQPHPPLPPLLQHLRQAAPQIAITIHWSPDPDDCWGDAINRDWTAGLDPDDWQAWQSEVRAVAIVGGTMIQGSAYLGGTWEKASDHPAQSNPDISGYLPQMLEEAVLEIVAQVPNQKTLRAQGRRAVAFLQAEMQSRYAAQRSAPL